MILPSSKLRAVKNVFASWLGLGTTMLVGFFLTPFILHRLGDTAYGLWILLTTFTGYYGLLDFGIRSAIVRYVARHSATGDTTELNRVISTTFFTYMSTATVLILVTGVVAWRIDSIFTISPEWLSTARNLLIVVGAGTALGMPITVFGGVLEGFQRFTWVGVVQTVATLVRAGLIIYALKHGDGIFAVGVITVTLNLVSALIFVAVAFRLYPGLRLRPKFARLATLGTLASFGVVTFWLSIAFLLRFQFDSIVVASFISVQAVTFFSISSKLITYVTDGVQAMAQIFTPMSSVLDASGDLRGLRRVLVISNRYSAFLILPAAGVLMITGSSILTVWVGASYAAISYTVLAILTIPTTLYLAQAGSTKILYGMARHKTLAVVMLVEGVTNLGLSILFARWYGINGVALGTAIPLTLTSIFFLPPHLCKILDLPVREFVFESYFYPLLCSAPAYLILWAGNRWIHPTSWASLLGVLAAGGAVYGAAFLMYLYFVERGAGSKTGRSSYVLGSAS